MVFQEQSTLISHVQITQSDLIQLLTQQWKQSIRSVIHLHLMKDAVSIEVMGRDAGYLALWCGIANGAESILMPEEHGLDEKALIKDILENKKRGKTELHHHQCRGCWRFYQYGKENRRCNRY